MHPPGNFYILSPQKRNFLDSEHKFPIMSVPKAIVTFQFYLLKLMPSVVFNMTVIPRPQRNELIILYLCANQITFKSINCNGKSVSFLYIYASKGTNNLSLKIYIYIYMYITKVAGTNNPSSRFILPAAGC